MGGLKILHFVDFGIFGRAQTFQKQFFLFLETPGHPTKIKNSPWNSLYLWRHQSTSNDVRKSRLNFKLYYFYKSRSLCNSEVLYCWKRRAPSNPEDPFIKSSKSWRWDQYFPEDMKWQLGIGIVETKKPKTTKPRNPKPTNRNQETFSFSSKGLSSTPRHTDSHPSTRPPSWGTRVSSPYFCFALWFLEFLILELDLQILEFRRSKSYHLLVYQDWKT